MLTLDRRPLYVKQHLLNLRLAVAESPEDWGLHCEGRANFAKFRESQGRVSHSKLDYAAHRCCYLVHEKYFLLHCS